MTKAPAKHTQADWNRAVKAASQLRQPCTIEAMPDGTMRIIVKGKIDQVNLKSPSEREWRL